MKTAGKIVKLLSQYIGGIVSAYMFGMWGTYFICLGPIMCIVKSQSDAVPYYLLPIVIFLGIPVSATLGMLCVDKLVFKLVTGYKSKIISGCLMGVLGSTFVYWVLPFLGAEVWNWLPSVGYTQIAWGIESFLLISVFFSLIGYNLAGLFSRKVAQ